MLNLYTKLSRVRSKLGVSTSKDDELLEAIESASREADRLTNRTPLGFFETTGVRYFDGDGSDVLQVDDLLTVSSLKIDTDGNGSFETTIDSADYHLEPYNDYPKTAIRMAMSATSYFPEGSKTVQITGTWGFAESSDPWTVSTVTLGDDVDDEVTTIPVSAEGVLEVGQTIKIGSEQMVITAVTTDASNEITVDRPVNGTTAASHSSGAAVSTAVYPRLIDQYVYEWAMDRFKNAAAMGYSSFRLGDMNYTRSAIVDNMMDRMVELFRKVKIQGV